MQANAASALAATAQVQFVRIAFIAAACASILMIGVMIGVAA